MRRIFLLISLGLLVCLGLQAQNLRNMTNTGYPTILSDTVVNTATATLGNVNSINGTSAVTTVQVVVTKISGTVAGTISLLGSLDGTNFKALTILEASTAIPTFTATDVASQNFIWRVNGNPCPYYRISWTGTGTMTASFSGKILSR